MMSFSLSIRKPLSSQNYGKHYYSSFADDVSNYHKSQDIVFFDVNMAYETLSLQSLHIFLSLRVMASLPLRESWLFFPVGLVFRPLGLLAIFPLHHVIG